MPIFVKGELLKRRSIPFSKMGNDDDTRWTEYLDDQQTSLLRAAMPSGDEDSHMLDNIDVKGTLDVIQRTINIGKPGTLADDLSSVGSIPHPTPVSVVRPIADYDTIPQEIPHLIRRSRKELSINTNISDELMSTQQATKSVASSTASPSPYTLNPIYKWEQMKKNRSTWSRRQPRLTVLTDTIGEEERQDSVKERFTESSLTVERVSETTSANHENIKDEDEPSRTLEDLLGLLEKGYRVKLHTFRGRERAFLFLRRERELICLKKDSSTRMDGESLTCLEAPIDNIANLEVGRKSESGFLLGPLTSFSLGMIDPTAEAGLRYFDLEAASPVQREVLVSTLMIMMDAYSSKRPSAQIEYLSDVQEESNSEELESETGTFAQPILCSPSLGAIPCSPSLELAATGNGMEHGVKEQDDMEHDDMEHDDRFDDYGASVCDTEETICTDGYREVIRLDDIDSFTDVAMITLQSPSATSHDDGLYHSFQQSQEDHGASETFSLGSYISKRKDPESISVECVDGFQREEIDVYSSSFAGYGSERGGHFFQSFDDKDKINRRAFFGHERKTKQYGGESERFLILHSSTSSGDMTDQASNVVDSTVGSTAPIITLADDLVIDTHVSDQAFDNEPSKVEDGGRITASIASRHSRLKKESYIFEEEESVLSGSADNPIETETDPILRLRSKAHALSFSFSDPSVDGDGESFQGLLRSVRSRRVSRQEPRGRGSSYPAKILEAEELQSSLDGNHSSEAYQSLGENSQSTEGASKGGTSATSRTMHWGSPQTSLVEQAALMDIHKPNIEIPTPRTLPVSRSSHTIGGWCSDDVCTGTLSDMAKSCTGIFATERAKTAPAHSGCLDPSMTEAQAAMVEEYIASALGAPSAVYSYFTVRNAAPTTDTLVGASASTPEPVVQETQKFRNRASRLDAQADRLRNLRYEMTFAHALKHSKEMSFIRTTQSFDDAKILPQLADNAAQQLHESPLLDSLVSNMIHHWGIEIPTKGSDITTTEEESVYYDSDPEDVRPRTLHRGARNVRQVDVLGSAQKKSSDIRPKVVGGFGIERVSSKLDKRTDEDTVKEIVQSMMNERLLVMWHPTQTEDMPNRSPFLTRLWIESGVYLIDGSFLLPKLCWVKAFGKCRNKAALEMGKDLQKLDLLDICRIRACDQVDRTLHPFASTKLCWFIETQQEVFLFESETTEERDRVVYGLKLVVARLASLLMLRDIRAADEFFGAMSSGVPGEAPVWAAAGHGSEDAREDASSTTAVKSSSNNQ